MFIFSINIALALFMDMLNLLAAPVPPRKHCHGQGVRAVDESCPPPGAACKMALKTEKIYI
jgi:hypothetical protein